MEKVGFIGSYDKIDLILYIAKILAKLNKKILVIDTTEKQKARYIVPAINPTFSYITEFENIDVAVGFKSIEQIKEYTGLDETQELNYDIALIDIDNAETIENVKLLITDKNYFVTAFDLYSLKKGIEILEKLNNPLKLTKVLFERDISKEEDEYLNFLSLGKKIVWDEEIIYFPVENGDNLAIAENQRIGKIKFKNISMQYKQGIIYLINHLTGTNEKTLKNIMKNIE